MDPSCVPVHCRPSIRSIAVLAVRPPDRPPVLPPARLLARFPGSRERERDRSSAGASARVVVHHSLTSRWRWRRQQRWPRNQKTNDFPSRWPAALAASPAAAGGGGGGEGGGGRAAEAATAAAEIGQAAVLSVLRPAQNFVHPSDDADADVGRLTTHRPPV